MTVHLPGREYRYWLRLAPLWVTTIDAFGGNTEKDKALRALILRLASVSSTYYARTLNHGQQCRLAATLADLQSEFKKWPSSKHLSHRHKVHMLSHYSETMLAWTPLLANVETHEQRNGVRRRVHGIVSDHIPSSSRSDQPLKTQITSSRVRQLLGTWLRW